MHDLVFSIFPNQTFVDLGLYQFGRESCEAGHSFGPARRNHYLFHYVISGNGHTKTYHIEEGQGFMIFPKQVTTYIADIDSPWEYAWLEFDGLRVKLALESAGVSMSHPVYSSNSDELKQKMRDEILYITDHSDASAFNLIGHLYLFMDYLTRSSEGAKVIERTRLRDFYVREAMSYIENHFYEEMTIGDIAKAIGLDRSYFGKIFRNAVGKSPQSFLMHYRMIKAAELLVQTKLSVCEIGVSVGYQDQMNFSRAFKAIYSVSPREWRKKNADYTFSFKG